MHIKGFHALQKTYDEIPDLDEYEEQALDALREEARERDRVKGRN